MKHTPVRKKRKGPPRRGRVRDPKYLAWIRTLPCVCCYRALFVGSMAFADFWMSYWYGGMWPRQPSEAGHTGPHGLSQKSHDRSAIPLCGEHHRTGKASYERLGKKFWVFWGLDRIELTKELVARYEAERAPGS